MYKGCGSMAMLINQYPLGIMIYFSIWANEMAGIN